MFNLSRERDRSRLSGCSLQEHCTNSTIRRTQTVSSTSLRSRLNGRELEGELERRARAAPPRKHLYKVCKPTRVRSQHCITNGDLFGVQDTFACTMLDCTSMPSPSSGESLSSRRELKEPARKNAKAEPPIDCLREVCKLMCARLQHSIEDK